MSKKVILLAGLLGSVWCSAAAAGDPDRATLVHKVAEDFEETAWVPDQWSNAKGRTSLESEAAPDAKTAKCLKIEAAFSGSGFEHFTADPPMPLWIPGDAKSVTLRHKIGDGRYALKVAFTDGWGRDQVKGAYLSWDVPTDKAGKWKTATFQVPPDWVRPIRLAGITTHNWEARNEKKTVGIWIDDIEVETDIKDVAPKTGLLSTWVPERNAANPARAIKKCPSTPLIAVNMTSPEECNVFTRTEPQVWIRLRNWKPGELTGALACRLFDNAGALVDRFDRSVAVESSTSIHVPLKTEHFGLYRLAAKLTLSDGTVHSEEMTLAHLPAGKDLTEQQKLASPYGLNVHSGEKVVLVPFRKAGIVWFREYAFSYDWLLRQGRKRQVCRMARLSQDRKRLR